MLDQRTFRREMTKAKILIDEGDRPGYWRGYRWGLMRRYYGDKFRTEDEHKKTLSLVGDQNELRNQFGLGYHKGYFYGT